MYHDRNHDNGERLIKVWLLHYFPERVPVVIVYLKAAQKVELLQRSVSLMRDHCYPTMSLPRRLEVYSRLIGSCAILAVVLQEKDSDISQVKEVNCPI